METCARAANCVEKERARDIVSHRIRSTVHRRHPPSPLSSPGAHPDRRARVAPPVTSVTLHRVSRLAPRRPDVPTRRRPDARDSARDGRCKKSTSTHSHESRVDAHLSGRHDANLVRGMTGEPPPTWRRSTRPTDRPTDRPTVTADCEPTDRPTDHTRLSYYITRYPHQSHTRVQFSFGRFIGRGNVHILTDRDPRNSPPPMPLPPPRARRSAREKSRVESSRVNWIGSGPMYGQTDGRSPRSCVDRASIDRSIERMRVVRASLYDEVRDVNARAPARSERSPVFARRRRRHRETTRRHRMDDDDHDHDG